MMVIITSPTGSWYIQQAQNQWRIRHMMMHLVEVMLVLDGKHHLWARAIRDRRSIAGVPLPSVSFHKMRMRTRRSGSEVLCDMMRCLCEGVDKEIMRMVVSFI